MDRRSPPPDSVLPFGVDGSALTLLLAVIVIAVLWWMSFGAEFLYHRFRFCVGCRRDAMNCSCPVTLTFTAWNDLSDEERDDGV